jgi:hypothetical protein
MPCRNFKRSLDKNATGLRVLAELGGLFNILIAAGKIFGRVGSMYATKGYTHARRDVWSILFLNLTITIHSAGKFSIQEYLSTVPPFPCGYDAAQAKYAPSESPLL